MGPQWSARQPPDAPAEDATVDPAELDVREVARDLAQGSFAWHE